MEYSFLELDGSSPSPLLDEAGEPHILMTPDHFLTTTPTSSFTSSPGSLEAAACKPTYDSSRSSSSLSDNLFNQQTMIAAQVLMRQFTNPLESSPDISRNKRVSGKALYQITEGVKGDNDQKHVINTIVKVEVTSSPLQNPSSDSPGKASSVPIGVFWDIENCQVPRSKSAMALVEVFRRRILKTYQEAEFIVVCDTQKERKEVLTELNNSQVTVVHVFSSSKNAADDKLRQCIRRFTENMKLPCAVMLVSSDVNFAPELSDLKNRKKVHVILVHGSLASETLLLCSNERYLYDSLLDEVPSSPRFQKPPSNVGVHLNVLNLPPFVAGALVRQRVQQIAENCGGKMVHHYGSRGVLRFSTPEAAQRAVLRMEGEDVFGYKISLQIPHQPSNHPGVVRQTDELPLHHTKNMIGSAYKPHFTPFPPPPNPAQVAPPRLLDFRPRCVDGDGSEVRLPPDSFSKKEMEPERQQNVEDTFARAVADADGPNRWDYYRTPSEYLVERTPQGHRRIRGATPKDKSPEVGSFPPNQSEQPVATYTTFPVIAADVLKPAIDYKQSQNYVTSSSFTSLASSTQRPLHVPSTVSPVPVDLHVTNLDQSIGAKEMKTLLTNVFKQHVTVQNVTVHLQSDGHLAAVVRVPSVQDAQFCVSQLHRRKLGSKRIMISYDQNGSSSGSGRSTPTPLQIRAQVNALLSEIPQRRLPLFKFRELYEQRYMTSISLADLHRLRDILHVTDDAHGRCVVFLQQNTQNNQQQQYGGDSVSKDGLSSRSNSSEPELSVSEMPRCPIHDSIPNGSAHGWAEPEPMPELPLVFATLHQISLHIHCLLQSHGGTIPLASVPRCYEMEVGPLKISEDKGVPLEHLISCVKGVGIVTVAGHKRLQWSGKNEQTQESEPLNSLNPSLMPQMSLLCRELVDLLKVAPQCRIPFSKFIPQYHHHFGRQCRVADYGYTRLIDLLESLPHVVQILGEGTRRYVTLSHRAQMKRFTSDLLRILKAQASKQMNVSLFSAVYEKTLGRPFDPRDYGLCQLSDLLAQVAEASVVVMATADGEEIIALPKREQTLEEMERTKQFAVEVVELLKHAPQCKLDFAKFIPAYHHNFGRQCRVADYGCTKLVELFEAIPDTVQVFETENEIEKYVQLTTKQRLKILAEQVTTLVRNHSGHRPLLLENLPDVFRIHFGFALRPEQYEVRNLEELVAKLRSHVQVVYTERGAEICLIDQNALLQAKNRVLKLLYPIPEGAMYLRRLLEHYKDSCGQECPLSFLTDHMDDIVSVDNETHAEPMVRLVPILLFARQVHILVNESGGRLAFSFFESSFLERFGVPCRPANYGHPNSTSLLQAIPQVVTMRGKGPRRVLMVNREIGGLTPPSLPPAPKPSSIKPPAHWLTQQTETKPAEREDVDPNAKGGIYEDLKQFFSSNSSSSLMYTPVPTFIPSMPWSPVWGMTMGLPISLSPPYAPNPGYQPWNAGAACNYPYNYWFTAWPAPVTYPVPLSPVTTYSPSRASVAEIEEVPSGSHGNPPPASLLPHPSMIMGPQSEEEDTGKNPVRSRIAAQFRNPVVTSSIQS